jgi:hypothetical protein
MIQNGREGILIFPKSEREIIKSLKKILKWESKSISQYANKYRWDNIVKKTYEDYIKC